MVKVEKLEGEYHFTSPYDPWINVAAASISESLEFKTFILENFISSNSKLINLSKDENYKKINESIVLLSGENFKFLLTDNIYRGILTLVSESFQSLSTKKLTNTENLAQDYKMIIDKDKVKAIYRNPQYTLRLISFFIYRKIGITPSELLIEKLSLILKEIIPTNLEKLELKVVRFSKYFLPNKVILSIEVITDSRKNYYLLTYKNKRWNIKSINLQKGSVNLIHKLLIESTEYIKNILESQNWLTQLSYKVKTIIDFISTSSFLKYSLVTLVVIILAYFIRIKFLLLLLLLYLVWIIYKRTCLFIIFKGEV